MSLDAERAVVGACIFSEEMYDKVALASVSPADFADEAMALMFEVVSGFRDDGRQADEVSVAAVLSKTQRWHSITDIESIKYVGAIVDSASTPAWIASHLEIIKSESMNRLIMGYCSDLAGVVQESGTADEKLSKLHALIPTVADAKASHVNYGDAAKAAIKYLIDRIGDDGVAGISSGHENIDRVINGYDPGMLVIIGGRPGMAKSIWMMEHAQAAAKQGNVFVFSLEMSTAELAMRGLSSLGMVDSTELQASRIDDHMLAGLQHANAQMKELPILIDDRPDLHVDVLRTRARVMARKNPPVMICVDYLQLLAGKGSTRADEIAYVSRSLKAMAKELNCVVVAPTQLNRGCESRPDKRPMVSDLKESGQIEQDADVIWLTYIAEKYFEDTPRAGLCELICGKLRGGQAVDLFFEFQGRYQRFIEYRGAVPPLMPESEKPRRSSSMRGAMGSRYD